MAIALAASFGLAVGGAAGFVLAVVQLHAKRLRNARLVRHGQSPLRDCVLTPWHLPMAGVGAAASALLAVWLPTSEAVLYGSLALPGLLLLTSLIVATYQLATVRSS